MAGNVKFPELAVDWILCWFVVSLISVSVACARMPPPSSRTVPLRLPVNDWARRLTLHEATHTTTTRHAMHDRRSVMIPDPRVTLNLGLLPCNQICFQVSSWREARITRNRRRIIHQL